MHYCNNTEACTRLMRVVKKNFAETANNTRRFKRNIFYCNVFAFNAERRFIEHFHYDLFKIIHCRRTCSKINTCASPGYTCLRFGILFCNSGHYHRNTMNKSPISSPVSTVSAGQAWLWPQPRIADKRGEINNFR